VYRFGTRAALMDLDRGVGEDDAEQELGLQRIVPSAVSPASGMGPLMMLCMSP